MSSFDAALWRNMLVHLTREHAPICRQWFEQLEPGALDGGVLTIHTTSHVQKNYLQTQCVRPFTEAVQSATGALVAVRFVNGKPPADEPATIEPLAPEANLVEPDIADALTPEPADSVAQPPPEPAATNHRPARRYQAGPDWPFDQMLISPDYSFDQFVTGPENALAYSASVAVANKPGLTYNPLFIHGGVGLGKTHLLQAIAQRVLDANPQTRICYLSCDAFVNDFLDCVQHGRMSQFRHRYRELELLVIDDIHFLANHERTQEEFFHTFNELYQLNRQIVLSSDSTPSEIPQLEDRLISRFQWGLVAPVARPHFETRVAIVRAKTSLRGLSLPDDVVAYIAKRIDTNARELEGAITTLQGHMALHAGTIDLPLAQSALGEQPPDNLTSRNTLQDVIDAVTGFYSVKLSDLQSKRRHKSITRPRQLCMWLARRHTRFSLEEIGGYFGGRDHSTVMHSLRTVDESIGADADFARDVEQIEKQVAEHHA